MTSGTYTFEDQGITRTYRIFVPSSVSAEVPAPLILVFHGWAGDENEFLSSATVSAEAD